MGFSFSENLGPLKQYPTNIVLDLAAERMFNDTNSAWSKLPWPQNGFVYSMSSGLVNVPAYRWLIVRELDRKEVCASITLQSSDMVNYMMRDLRISGSFIYSFPESANITNGASADLRWCDWAAISLAIGKYIPPFNPFAPVEKRDLELEKAKALLLQK
jgi:hypothetical protein